MKWTEIAVWTTPEASEAVSELLTRLGAAGVAIEDPNDIEGVRRNPYGNWYEVTDDLLPKEGARVSAYFSELVDISSFVEHIKKELDSFKEYGLDPGRGDVETREVDEEDWANAWKQFFKPVRVTERLTIKPTWENYTPAPGEQIIELDPGMAFGTGTHPTTVLCLRMLEKWMPAGARVVDVGTGTAVLSIAAAKLGAEHVLALDLDPVAVKVAKENVAQNHEENRVSVRTNDLLTGVEGSFSLVVANILADIVARMIPDAYKVLDNNGIFIASGIIREKANWVMDQMEQYGFKMKEVVEENDWAVLVAIKPVS
ncbi:50S ribosomal protein L11 methyltransferase [Effusibacillus lacus]|uniref:Ribosomal protein L11 methyltransferase n=1 Tax=Effusibacillus lacus TaxID=1348429 RepID=A0A292YRL6_9BACL|nr:50S ribosomal protein L11 methyltransferase [Effusibacillus lacus]TCS70400.1 [LSU ribosomal protein L11P]-lysine N-methyltransferase [Effusibacillus lacus]GAX91551.1 ribosomal protein L11 methyltransferase [Effusibacillus lacus]